MRSARTKAAAIIVAVLLTPALHAGVVAPYQDCDVVVSNDLIQFNALPQKRIFDSVLVKFSIEPSEGTPHQFILCGRVVSNNTGTADQGVAVSLYGDGKAPLAAITDIDGGFRFRIRINDTSATNFQHAAVFTTNLPPLWKSFGSLPPQLSFRSLSNMSLCLGGQFNTKRALISGPVSRYRLEDLTTSTNQQILR